MDNWRDYWVYKEIKDNYKIIVKKNLVEIRFKDDNSIYASFDLQYDKEFDNYFVYDRGSLLNDELEFTSTFDEVVCSCLYYFHSRY